MEVRRTIEFDAWLENLRDREAQRRILLRIRIIMSADHLGVVRSVGKGVSELKLEFGPGYRVYYTRLGNSVVLLLTGGDKSSQTRDILKAQQMAALLD